jgi:hypothetical protein
MLVVLIGCATPTTKGVGVSDAAVRAEADRQRDWAVQSIVEDQKRLARVGRTLSTNAHNLCGKDVAPNTGAVFLSKSRSELSPSYEKLYGIAERPTVLFVLDESPASAAGLQAGDIVTQLNNAPVPNMDSLDGVFRTLGPDDSIRMRIERNGAVLALEFKPEMACRYSFVLNSNPAPNAYADGARIVVTRGMMAFAKDDLELSLVLAHELAHNVMHHMDAKAQNAVGEFLNLLLAAIGSGERAWGGSVSSKGTLSYPQEFEAEADYVGLYILASTGLPFRDTARFWRRLANSQPSNIGTRYTGSHPSFPYRMLALEATAKEISEKMEQGLPIEPNMKDGHAPLSRR